MYCNDVASCFAEINAYCAGKETGHVLLVNTENLDVYQEILSQLRADSSKQVITASKFASDRQMPIKGHLYGEISGQGVFVLVGLSQMVLLQSVQRMDDMIQELLELPIRGHAIVLLNHSARYINKYFSSAYHPDYAKRIILVAGVESELPKIRLAKSPDECSGTNPLNGFSELLTTLESLSDPKVASNLEITVITSLNPNLFSHSFFSVSAVADVYDRLCKNYPELRAGTEKTFGSNEEWIDLEKLTALHGSFMSAIESLFGSSVNLPSRIEEVFCSSDSTKQWLLWLAMKISGVKANKYLSYVLEKSTSIQTFIQYSYQALLDFECCDTAFVQLYAERKSLISHLPKNPSHISQYCSKIGRYEKNAVYYLTDATNREEMELLRCLECYDFSYEELMALTKSAFPKLHLYLKKFIFSPANTKVSAKDTALLDTMTNYFGAYKFQKVKNRINADFLKQVETFAVERPYNKLQRRVNLLRKPENNRTQFFFFDALGVEYLSYIEAKAVELDLMFECSIGKCELPSITSNNKDFFAFSADEIHKIDELDELKHHSQVIDYRKCKLPIHIFRELDIIDKHLIQIRSLLEQDDYDRVILVSDHGASRLAVIYEHESSIPLTLDEKGQHSGRCCPADADPCIPTVTYENGYAVLANYERFKGGRKANVEVHGGASLEEVLVPVITLSKKPDTIEICFTNNVVELKQKEVASIVVYSNIPLSNPQMIVKDKGKEYPYAGVFYPDSHHIRFELSDFKRSKKDLHADIYDGNKTLASDLVFQIQKKTGREVNFF